MKGKLRTILSVLRRHYKLNFATSFDPAVGPRSCPILQLSLMENQIAQDCAQTPPQTILLVEDFDDTRLMMKLWLVRNGYRVIEAEIGAEAVSLAERAFPDLIIIDVVMPGMNLLDARHRIREHPSLRKTRLVAVFA